jgi:hypothetical protein
VVVPPELALKARTLGVFERIMEFLFGLETLVFEIENAVANVVLGLLNHSAKLIGWAASTAPA